LALSERFHRWCTCSQCKQGYHGVVRCALGWACWKTYVGRPEVDKIRQVAMNELGLGLSAVGHHENALSVQEAELDTLRRVGAPDKHIVEVLRCLASTYQSLGRNEKAMGVRKEIYSGFVELYGEEDRQTFGPALSYASSLVKLRRFKEAKSLLRKTTPVTRRVLGESHVRTLSMRAIYARALYLDASAYTLDDLAEAVTTLEDAQRIARRVLGGQHPTTKNIEADLRLALRVREAP